MALVEINELAGLVELIGREVGPSGWLTIDQDQIDRFADLVEDHQWIHVDRERAATDGPYGTTIAHGNLTLALIDRFRRELFSFGGRKMGINLGWDRVRFPAPVRSGSRIRARATVIEAEPIADGWWRAVTRFAIEAEGSDRPCCVADSVSRMLEDR